MYLGVGFGKKGIIIIVIGFILHSNTLYKL